MSDDLCPGCGQVRDDMAWVDGRWLCDWCRTVVCAHGKSIYSFCGKCRVDYLSTGLPRMSGLMRADWKRTATS